MRATFDYLTVPGTIAAFYPDATAAFVLSSRLDYVIDPRTPLFQERIDRPKASHFSLAKIVGAAVEARMGDQAKPAPVRFDVNVYTDGAIGELVSSVVEFQRTYGGRAANIQAKFDRYNRLVELATGYQQESQAKVRSPSFTLAPYFAAESIGSPWWAINRKIWEACAALPDRQSISPVVALDGLGPLPAAFKEIPKNLSTDVFFWLAGFDERRASEPELRTVWAAVQSASAQGYRLVNLYGGFFSICLSYAGLWGFNNGLGYSESRSWPELPATGAAPARYYVPSLHLYLPPALAQLVVEGENRFACRCMVCELKGTAIVSFSYEELKAHFALARHQEIAWVNANSSVTIASSLEEAANQFDELKKRLPRTHVDISFLRRWAQVLRRP